VEPSRSRSAVSDRCRTRRPIDDDLLARLGLDDLHERIAFVDAEAAEALPIEPDQLRVERQFAPRLSTVLTLKIP
jgi:hypothetical protein